jgi:hypothetical protein
MEKQLEVLLGQELGSPYILTLENLMLSIFYTMAVAGLMTLVYRGCHDTLTYRKKFNVMLWMLALLSTVLLALIQNHPLLSLGVLGSLSICRIRTNTRDPRDLGFVFWALTIGIASAVGAFLTGAVSSVILGGILLFFHKLEKAPDRQMIVVRGEKTQLEQVQRVLHQMGKGILQSKNVFAETFELVYELQMKESEEEQLLVRISKMEGIHGVNILAPETKVA